MTTLHHLRCDWLEEARMRLLGQAIIFHDELFVKVITMNDVIGELKKERKGCYDANSTLQPKPGHCGHECVQACLAPSYNSCEYIGSTYNVVSKNDTRRKPSAENDSSIRREAYEQGKRDALLEKDNIQVSTLVGYDTGYDRGAREERERVLEVISDGKSALYEIKPDGNWDYILQAKMDVLCWIEESLRSSK